MTNKDYKRCTRCLATKKILEFYNDRRRPDGKSGHCIACKKKICLQGQSDRRKYVKAAKEYERAMVETRKILRAINSENYIPFEPEFQRILFVIERALEYGNQDGGNHGNQRNTEA